MSPPAARTAVHSLHLLGFLVLGATGLLLLVPDLRAAVTGGRSMVIARVHRWGGVAFSVLPALVLLGSGPSVLFARGGAVGLIAWWKAAHLGLTLATSLALLATGLLLWGRTDLPEELADVSQTLHVWLTYAVSGIFGAHLAALALTALRARLAPGPAIAGGGTSDGVQAG